MGSGNFTWCVSNGEYNDRLSDLRGKGFLEQMNGDRYKGEWIKNGIFHGYGILKRLNNYTYIGQFQQGKMQGKARIIYSRHNFTLKKIYFGGMYESKLNGRGKIISQNAIQQGTYFKGKQNGYLSSVINGVILKGQFAQNQSPTIYLRKDKQQTLVGELIDSGRTAQNINGTFQITVTRHNGQICKGQMMQNNKLVYNGFIIQEIQEVKRFKGISKVNNDTYTGDWLNNYYHGTGSCSYNNGSIYCGEWVRGQKHGYGCYITINGIQEGLWVEDKFQIVEKE